VFACLISVDIHLLHNIDVRFVGFNARVDL
jgi:hypothetical protein